MSKLPTSAFLGLGFPRLTPEQSEEQLRVLGAMPRQTRLVAGISLLGMLMLALFTAIALASPALTEFEVWFGIPPHLKVTGISRVLGVACVMLASAIFVAAIWCAVTYIWVRAATGGAFLSPSAAEAIARGNFFG